VTGEEVRQRVRALAGEMSQRPLSDPVQPSARLEEDLNFDSLEKVELAVAVEQEFGLRAIQEEDVMDIETVGDLEELVLQVLERQASV